MRVTTTRAGALAAVVLGSAVFPIAAGIPDGPYRERPVVLHGSDLPGVDTRGIPEEDLAAFRWTGATWAEFPVQVDGYFDQETCRSGGGELRCFTENRPALDDVVDPDPSLDADDEVVFLAREVGSERAPADAPPPAGVDDPVVRYDVEVRSPAGDTGWVHLFRRTGGGTARYEIRVYTTDLGTHPDGEQLTPPEDTAIGCTDGDPNQITHLATEAYCAHYATRWSLDDLVLRTARSDCLPGGDFAGTRLGDPAYEYPDDLLDRWKGHESLPGADPDDAMWGRCSVLRGERVGPVRYVRGTLGAKSGVTTTVYSYFYPRSFEVDTRLGVHPMPGIARLVDWNAHAVGARLYHRHDAGEAVEGAADADGAHCGTGGGSTCPAGTDGDLRVYDGTDEASRTASTYDVLAGGADLWDYLVTDRARVHVYTRFVSDPTASMSFARYLYADDAAAPLNPGSNWEEHRASIASTGVYFDLVRETYQDRFRTIHAFELLDPVQDPGDADNRADGEARADAARRPLTVVASDASGSTAPSPPAAPTGLRVR